MARTALSLHALREVGRDDKDLQPLLLGGGVNPVNNKDPKAMLTEADRKVSYYCCCGVAFLECCIEKPSG